MGDRFATVDTEAETASETESAAPSDPLPLPDGAEPVDGVPGYHALIKGGSVTVFSPDGTEIASGSRQGGVAVGRVGDVRLVSDGYGDRRLSSFAMLAARHHRAATDPSARDKVWVRWEEDGVAAVYGTDKYDDDDLRAVKAGNLYWSGQRQARVTGRRWNPETRDRNLAAVLQAFARQDRNIVVLGPGQTPEDLVASPTAAAAVPAPQASPATAAPAPPPEPEPEPEPLDLTGLSYEELVEAEDAAAVERSRDYSTAAEARYRALRQERGRRLLDRVATAVPVTEMSGEELAAESDWWKANSYKTPFHSSDEEYRTLERHFRAVRTERYARIARTILAGPAAADLDDEALERTYEQVGRTWTRLPTEHELHDQVADYRKAVQEERIARRARSYSERTPVGEMTLEDLIAESAELGSSLDARNEQSAYSYSDAVREARAARLKAVEEEWFQRGMEQHPEAARAKLGGSITGRRSVLIDGSVRAYGYIERQGKKFRALTDYDQRSRIGDFDSAPAAMAALVQRYDQDPETLPRRTWGLEREVDLPVSAYDPLVSWLRRRPSKLSREYDRVLTLLTPFQLPTQTKVVNPLTNQVMRAYPFHFEEGLLGELARIAERTTEDLREQSLDENLPKREREAAKRRIPAMGAALIGINAVIEQVRAAGGDVERRGVDQSRLAAQMAALAGTVNEQEEGEADGDDKPVRDAAAQALGGVPAAGAGGDGGSGPALPQAGGADERGDRRGGGGPGGEPGAGDGLPGPGRAAGADQGDGAGAGAARDAAAAGGRGQPGGAAESGSSGAGGDPQGAGEPVARFRPDPADLPRGPLARAEANLEAIKVLRTLESARRGATTEEKRILARWSGWGSVPTVFLDEPDPDEPIYAPGGEWEGRFEADHARWESYDRVRSELRELLDPFEWRAASRAVLSAHYTPQGVAEAMWQGLAAYGFDGGEVLEAGCGSGAFFGVAPENARLTGVEVDPTTAAIAARIYPHANVLAESFADTDAPVGTFDLVIGNVPFAQAPFGERRYGAAGHSLHNGFIIKQLALLRPGGYMAVITSRWTLDGEDTSARRAMSRWGDLAAAYRLPAGTFGETADTDVVADVLVFRRRAEGEEPGDQTWIDAPERDLGGHTLPVNAYFTQHPENVLGRLTSETGPYGPRVTVQGDPDEAPRLLRERMEASAAAAVADGQGYVPHEDGPDRAPLLLQTAREKHATDFTGRLYIDDDGQIWQHVNGEDPIRVITADGASGTEQLRMLLSLRDTASELQELDRTGSDPDRAREVRSQLARLHTAYTTAHGPLSRPRQTRMALPTDEARAAARAAGVDLADDERLPTGWGWFRQDPHAAVVLGLEHWDRANDRPVPSEVLTRRPGTRRSELEPTDDPKAALAAVMSATGGVDLPLIASLLGTTPEEARRRLGTEVFDNPVTKKLEHAGAYLSGPVRVKLEQAREAAATDPKYAVNVAALEAVQPPPKRLGQFTAQLGAHWIPASLVQGFLREYLGDPTLQVSHNERYGWSLAAGKVPDAINALKGTERRSAVHIAKALLGRASMVVNTLDGNGVDEDATRAMRYKADAMRSAFEDYCTANTARVTLLTDAYNRQMNGHVVRNYDGLAPTLTGLTTERTPFPWQLSAAARMQFERGVVLAHEMGLGKTTTMVIGSQALKASGQITKPFAVVQPHLARQWLDEAKLLYPNADIHLITSDDLADGNRRRVLEWLRANTPDLVIFTEGAFGSIRMSPEQQELYLFREIESLKEQLKRERGVPHNNFALMQLERRLTTVEARIRRNDAPMRTPGEVYWDDLGFDYALIDEAHRFTAVGFRSKEAGGETASVRAVDLHQKLRWHHQVAEAHGGRPTVTLGTGTPMENSIFEQYSVLELATPWLLDQFGVHGPDLWAETFGQKVQRIEMAPDGSGLTVVERFSRFVSKSTMKTMWGLAADTKTGDDVGIQRPKLAGGAPELVLVEPTADQRARLQTLVARGQAIHAGDVTRDEDNMLAVSGEGRAVALDPRLVDPNAPAANKLVTAADIIAKGYHAHKDRTYAVSSRDDTPHPVPGGLFIVFCNSGTPGGNNKGGFDLYAELRDLLAARGVPRDMVQFAQDHHTPEKKAAMTDAANNGGIAVLMGSSEVLGTGFNGQNRAYALMHLDQDWTPAMMMQRNYRVIRTGNQHEEVNIYFLATKGSMDAWQVGLLTSKAEGLRDIQRPPGEGDDDNDTVEEIGESDWDYATMAAEIGGNPYMRQFMEAKLHLQGLEADRRNAAADRVRQLELLGIKEGELVGTRLAIAAREKALPKITETIRGAAFRIRIGGREFDRFGEAAPVLRQAVIEAVRAHQREGLGAWKKLGTFGGLDFAVQPEIAHGSGEIRAYIGFPELRHSESRCSMEDLAKGNIGATMLGRLATALEKAEDHQLMDRERLPSLEKEVAVLTAQQEAVNYGPAIEHARRRVELLDAVVGAITERDKIPELTESMLDPKKYPTESSRKKALQENAEKRAPLQAKVDAAVASLAAFDAENPAPEPVVLVDSWTEDNDTDEAYEQWRERQRIIVQQNREAGLGAPAPADKPAPASDDGTAGSVDAAPEPDAAAARPTGSSDTRPADGAQAPPEQAPPAEDGSSTEEPLQSQSPEVRESQTSEPPGDEPGPGTEEQPRPGFITRITPPAGTAIDRSWWVGAYGQWDTSNVGRKGVPSALIKFASEAEAAGWAVALRAGSVATEDGESLLGVWECEASGTTHDNSRGGQSLAVLSLMWTQAEGAKRWTFDTERSGAELGGRLLPGYVTLTDYRRALSQARVRQVDPSAKATAAATRETKSAEVESSAVEDVTTLYAPGEQVRVTPMNYDTWSKTYVPLPEFIGTVISYTRNGNYMVREPEHGTSKHYDALRELHKLDTEPADSETSPPTAEQRNTSQQPTEPIPEQDSDGYGTANLYEEFGLVPPERVPNPAPQDEPETDAEREGADGVPDGQMTVEEAQTEAAPAGPEGTPPAPPEPSVVLATPPTSSSDTPEPLQQSEQRFGGPEQLAQYADRADIIPTSESSSTVWLDGRLIGYVTDLNQTVGAAHDQSWPAGMRQAPRPRFESRPPFGHRDSVSALLEDSQAAVAELVARALQMPVPREAIDADTAWTLNATLGTIRLSLSYAGEDQEAAARLSALQQIVENLSAGQLTSTDLADDLALVHDELLWAADFGDTSEPYLTRAAEELAVLLAATRPDDPRAWRPDPFVAAPADVEQPTPTPAPTRTRARRKGSAAAPGAGTEQLGLFGDPTQDPSKGPAEPETATGSRAVPTEDGREAQLRAALIEGETIAPVSFTDRREPAAGWVLTTAGGHTFRLRPLTYSRPDEDQWEAGHDADGSYWWAANVEDRPLAAVLARIREDSATRTRFASLWARYGHLTAQAPQFKTTTERVQLEEGVYLVSRFGRVGLIASCRWGWEHLTDPDGAQGRTGEDWSRKGPDNRQYVAEWKIWNSAQEAIPNARLRVVAQLTDDMADTPDAYCDASTPYVGKCSAKRSGARYTVAVVTDQGSELGCYTMCARCLSHRLLNDEDRHISHRDVQSLAESLAKGDPKVGALHWKQWPDRIAELAGQMLSAALDAGETAPWPTQALTSQILTEACEAGDDRAMREARAEVKAAGGNTKAQKRAAAEVAAARQDRAALVARRGMTHMEAANEDDRVAVAILGLAGWRVEGSDAAPQPAEEAAPKVVDVNTLTVSPKDRNGEPSSYEFTVTGPGLTVGEYEISHDAQGRGARGITWRATWHGAEPSGRWDVISIGAGKGESAALAAVAEHATKTGGDLAAGFTVARRMHYDAGLWILPEVGESEAIQYHPDGSWTITAETGALYTVRRQWQGRTPSGDLAPLLIEDQAGTLIASCTAVDSSMSAWAPMLERLRLHATAVADGVPHATAVTLGGPGTSWVEAWCVCSWTERADVAEYADRAPAGEALAQAHRQAHHAETSAAAEAPAAAELPQLDVALPDVDLATLDVAGPYETDEEAQADIDRLSTVWARWDALPTVQRFYDADRQQRPDSQRIPTNPVAQLAAAYRDAERMLREGPAVSPDDLVLEVHTVAVWSGVLEPVVDEDLRGPLRQVREAAALLASRSRATVAAFEAELATLTAHSAEQNTTALESAAADTEPAEQPPAEVEDAPETRTEPGPDAPAAEDLGEPSASTPTATDTEPASTEDTPAPEDPQEAPEPPTAADDAPGDTAADTASGDTAAGSDPAPDGVPVPQDAPESAGAVPDEAMHEAQREASFHEQDRAQTADGEQQTPEPDTAAAPTALAPAPAGEDAPSDETARDASEEPTMTTPPIPETTDTPDEPITEEPPAPQRYFETVALAGDPGYQLRLSGLDGQPVDSGEVLRDGLVIATVHPGGDGGWYARLAAEPADFTYLADQPQEAAAYAAVMHSAFTGTPYGPPAGAAVGDETRQRVDVLRATLRDVALQHREAVALAAARAYPNAEQTEHFQALVGALDGLAAAVSENYGSQQMMQHLDAVQGAVNAWGGALPVDPGHPVRGQLAFPLASLLYDSRRLQDQVQATLIAVQAERAAVREQAAPTGPGPEVQPEPTAAADNGASEEPTESRSPELPDSQTPGIASDMVSAAPASPAESPQSATSSGAARQAVRPDSVHDAPPAAPASTSPPVMAAEGVRQDQRDASPLTADSSEASPEREPASGEDFALSTGANTERAPAPAGFEDIKADFAEVQRAWAEHVPAEYGSATDLYQAVETELSVLQRMFDDAVPSATPTTVEAAPIASVPPAPAPAEPASAPTRTAGHAQASKAASAQPASSAWPEEAFVPDYAPPTWYLEHASPQGLGAWALPALQPEVGAVNTALRRADAHVGALQEIPEWRQIQTVRGAWSHLWRVIRERAREHFDQLRGDGRVGDFFRKWSLRACERIGQWAQAGAERLLRDSDRPDAQRAHLPSAEALLRLGDAALSYSSQRGGRAEIPSGTSAATVDLPELRKLGEALERPMPTVNKVAGPGSGVSSLAARGRSTTIRRAARRPGDTVEQAGHLRRGGPEQQHGRKPTQR
ncbi:DEAD/DEAH box helicase family protein [Streptomyces mexicanus]|uniref:DEAD/DEAH box helicase family protein n=1 Tax=Streptomyces mexicanus TaxID=178566 RepID=UPI0023519B48|nr:DEAD/DEAH box helicase family protein [Streptomyces mexicanus]